MSMTQDEIDALIEGGVDNVEAEEETQIAQAGLESPAEDIGDAAGGDVFSGIDPKMELLYDLQLPVSIELGRTSMLIREILRLGRGSVIEFDKLVSEPVDVLINGKKVAEGEVVVIDKHFGIRVTTLVDPTERLRSIRR
jgi:flagellar motor switch protein FliN/FliY